MFQFVEDRLNDLDVVRILNTNSGECVTVVPAYGVNIVELVLKKGGYTYSVLDGNKQSNEFLTTRVFNNAKMIPFPNRIKDGKYIFRGKEYQLEKNFPHEQNAIHGLLYDKNFEISESHLSDLSGEIVFSYNSEAEQEGFPFSYETKIACKLDIKQGFICKTHVRNTGNEPMPFGEGWHPYFAFQKPVDTLHLKFESKHLIEVDDRLIPTGKVRAYNHFHTLKPIGGTQFDSCFLLQEGKDIHEAEIFDPDTQLKVRLWQQTGKNTYEYLQVYIPPDRMSVALEPMTCNINAFNNQDGLIILKPGQVYEALYGVYVV